MRHALLLFSIFLTACASSLTPTATPINPRLFPTETRTATQAAAETYRTGEPVTFHIDDTIHFCSNRPTNFSIIQATESGERELSLGHSCIGFVGAGIDQYCRNGQVDTVFAAQCSDAVACGEWPIHETITWDQKEYVMLTEACAGQTIHREMERQVPEGKYRIAVQVIQNNKITTKVIKELLIVSDTLDNK